MRKICILVFSVFFSVSCFADTILLRSGKVITGSLRSAGPSNVHVTVGGELMIFPTSTVKSIAFEASENRQEVDERQHVTDQLPAESELLLKVLSVQVVDNSRVDVVFMTLRSIDLSGKRQLDAGSLVEAHFPVGSGTTWMNDLKMDRALTETTVVMLQHQPVVDVSSGTEPSVLHRRGQQEDDNLAGVPEIIRVSKIVEIRFSNEDSDSAS